MLVVLNIVADSQHIHDSFSLTHAEHQVCAFDCRPARLLEHGVQLKCSK